MSMYWNYSQADLTRFLNRLGENPSVEQMAQAIVLIHYVFYRNEDFFKPKYLLYDIRNKNGRSRWSNKQFDKIVDEVEDVPNSIIDAMVMLFSPEELFYFGL